MERFAGDPCTGPPELGFVSKVVPTPPSASVDVRNAGEGTGATFTADAF